MTYYQPNWNAMDPIVRGAEGRATRSTSLSNQMNRGFLGWLTDLRDQFRNRFGPQAQSQAQQATMWANRNPIRPMPGMTRQLSPTSASGGPAPTSYAHDLPYQPSAASEEGGPAYVPPEPAPVTPAPDASGATQWRDVLSANQGNWDRATRAWNDLQYGMASTAVPNTAFRRPTSGMGRIIGWNWGQPIFAPTPRRPAVPLLIAPDRSRIGKSLIR